MAARGLTITAFNLLARFAHLGLFLLIGNLFGANHLTDTIFLIQAPLTLLMTIIAGAADVVVMPTMHRALENRLFPDALCHLTKRAVMVTTPISLVLLSLIATYLPSQSLWLYAIMAPIPVLSALSSIAMGTLNARSFFYKAALGPLYGSLLAIPLTIFLPANLYSLAWILLGFEIGRWFGLSIHLGSCQPCCLLRRTIPHSLFDWASRNAKVQMLGAFFVALIPLTDLLVAKSLESGSVTIVDYAGRLWNAIPLLFSGPLMIIYAGMSRSAARMALEHRQVHLLAIRFGLVGLLLSGCIAVATPLLIELIYSFGNFDPYSRSRLASLLAWYITGAPAYIVSLVYVRAISAHGWIHLLTSAAAMAFITNLILDIVLAKWLGINGIGIATALAHLLTATLLFFGYQKAAINSTHDSNEIGNRPNNRQ